MAHFSQLFDALIAKPSVDWQGHAMKIGRLRYLYMITSLGDYDVRVDQDDFLTFRNMRGRIHRGEHFSEKKEGIFNFANEQRKNFRDGRVKDAAS